MSQPHLLWYDEATVEVAAEQLDMPVEQIADVLRTLDAACDVVVENDREERAIKAEIAAAGGEDAYWNARGLYRIPNGWTSDPVAAARLNA